MGSNVRLSAAEVLPCQDSELVHRHILASFHLPSTLSAFNHSKLATRLLMRLNTALRRKPSQNPLEPRLSR